MKLWKLRTFLITSTFVMENIIIYFIYEYNNSDFTFDEIQITISPF